MKRLFCLIALVMFIVPLFATETVTLRLNLRSGTDYRYRVDIDMQAGAVQKIGMDMTMRVAAVTGDKNTLHTMITGMTIGDAPAPEAVMQQLRPMKIVTVLDAQGNTLSSSIENAPPGAANMGQSVSGATFPAGPVSVGSTWRGKATVSNQTVEADYKLTAIKTVGGKRLAVIEATLTVPNMKLNGPMRMTIDLATGMLEEMSLDGEVSAGSQKIPMKMAMRRI
jgi:hypothetical protein